MLKRLPGWAKVLLVLVTVVCVLVFILKFWWVIAIGCFFWLFVWMAASGRGVGQRRTVDRERYRERQPRDTYINVVQLGDPQGDISPEPTPTPKRGPFDPPLAKPGSWADEQRERTGY